MLKADGNEIMFQFNIPAFPVVEEGKSVQSHIYMDQ